MRRLTQGQATAIVQGFIDNGADRDDIENMRLTFARLVRAADAKLKNWPEDDDGQK
jgi:hypothetical protein